MSATNSGLFGMGMSLLMQEWSLFCSLWETVTEFPPSSYRISALTLSCFRNQFG